MVAGKLSRQLKRYKNGLSDNHGEESALEAGVISWMMRHCGSHPAGDLNR